MCVGRNLMCVGANVVCVGDIIVGVVLTAMCVGYFRVKIKQYR